MSSPMNKMVQGVRALLEGGLLTKEDKMKHIASCTTALTTLMMGASAAGGAYAKSQRGHQYEDVVISYSSSARAREPQVPALLCELFSRELSLVMALYTELLTSLVAGDSDSALAERYPLFMEIANSGPSQIDGTDSTNIAVKALAQLTSGLESLNAVV